MFLVQLTRQNKPSFFLMLWMAVAPLLFSTILTIWAIKYESYVGSFGILQWVVFYFCTILSMALAITPTTLIALFGGYFLGWTSVPYMLISYMAASALGYVVAKSVDEGNLFLSLKKFPKVEGLMNAMGKKQVPFIILCRISPVLPFAIMNVLLAMLKVKFSKFLWAGFLGMLPRTLLFIWVGSTARALKELISNSDNDISQISFLLLLILSIAGFYFYFKNLITRKLEEVSSDEL